MSGLYKTKLCSLFMRGNCTRESCTFAHGEEELRRVPRGRYSGFRGGDRYDRYYSPDREGGPAGPRGRRSPPPFRKRGRSQSYTPEDEYYSPEPSPAREIREKKRPREFGRGGTMEDAPGARRNDWGGPVGPRDDEKRGGPPQGRKGKQRWVEKEAHYDEQHEMELQREELEHEMRLLGKDVDAYKQQKKMLQSLLRRKEQFVDDLKQHAKRLEKEAIEKHNASKRVIDHVKAVILAQEKLTQSKEELAKSQDHLQEVLDSVSLQDLEGKLVPLNLPKLPEVSPPTKASGQAVASANGAAGPLVASSTGAAAEELDAEAEALRELEQIEEELEREEGQGLEGPAQGVQNAAEAATDGRKSLRFAINKEPKRRQTFIADRSAAPAGAYDRSASNPESASVAARKGGFNRYGASYSDNPTSADDYHLHPESPEPEQGADYPLRERQQLSKERGSFKDSDEGEHGEENVGDRTRFGSMGAPQVGGHDKGSQANDDAFYGEEDGEVGGEAEKDQNGGWTQVSGPFMQSKVGNQKPKSGGIAEKAGYDNMALEVGPLLRSS